MRKQEIKELYNSWRAAIIANDLVFLNQLFSADFTAINNAVKRKNKDEELLWLGTISVQYLLWKDKTVLIKADDKNGVVKCTQSLEVLIYDLPAKIDREIMLTFVMEDNMWQLQQFKENAVRFT